MKAEDCPNCGSDDVMFVCDSTSGHGDRSYTNGRVVCNNCSLSLGDLSNWGSPTEGDVKKALEDWNEMAKYIYTKAWNDCLKENGMYEDD